MKQSLYIFLLGIFMATQPLAAQEDNSELRQIYAQAETHYQIGQLEQATQLLKPHLASFSGGLKQNAYRLMALCYLANDNDVEAEKNAQLLLNENPYYTSMQDPPRFEDLINRLKSGRNATITTASKLAESVEDAPVPVTLITEDMIRMGTARNLLELLADYVPGINIVEGQEANFAMRGVYSESQENVLIMVDGIRLNSYCTNSVSPDYRISLENIKQIEILRGAASSLYGNVALTAVVNVITKSGADVNGLKIKAGLGNTHTSRADILWGKKTMETDFLLWGSIYNSRGTRYDIKSTDNVDGYGMIPLDGSIYVNGYNHSPSYDIGMKYRWRNLDFHLSHQYSKRNYIYTNIFIPTTYSYDKYETINSVKPGRGITSTNASIRYSARFKTLSFDAGVNMNFESVNIYNVIGDSLSPMSQQNMSLTAMFPWKDDEYTGDFPMLTNGVFQTLSWKNMNTCVDMKGVYEYSTKKYGKGSVLIGGQFDYFDMYYNDMTLGDKFGRIYIKTFNDRSPLFLNNHEQNMSAFIQLKHDFDNFIINTGARFDYRGRYTGKKIKQFSPRVALIWTPTKQMNYKLSYSHSFVDAPYFYRASKVVYRGNENLDAQFMDNYQMSAIYSFPKLHLKYETCVFYNYVMDVITLMKNGYMNFGTVKNVGWENVVDYQKPGFKAIATTYFQYVIDVQKTMDDTYASVSKNYINSIPNFTAHLQLQKLLVENFWLVAKASFNSRQTLYYASDQVMKYNSSDSLFDTEDNLPSCFLLDLGAKCSYRNWDFSLNCQNVFDHRYRLGGDRIPVLQQGRVILGTVSFSLK